MRTLPCIAALVTGLLSHHSALAQQEPAKPLTEAQMEELVLRTYPYVALFNVNNKFALDTDNPMNTGGYNKVNASTELQDHNMRAIARPNNDTLYITAMIDVTEEPMVLKIPAFDSKYVSFMVTAYDHYVNIPLSSGKGDFTAPTTMLFYSERTPGYAGEPVDGVEVAMETSGDFVSAVFRVMPHAAEPERLEANRNAMNDVALMSLSEFQGEAQEGKSARTLEEDRARFPQFGSDYEIFGDRFLEVMQFVVNHTTFDPDNDLDNALLALLKPLGVEPGKQYDPDAVAKIDGAALRATAERFAAAQLAKMGDPEFVATNLVSLFQPKGHMTPELLAFQSVSGPIGQPAQEAVYPPIQTEDGQPLNAQYDYEIVMTADEMPPSKSFWSVTLYDLAEGFFIPNEQKKYSVGENAGMKLDEDGGIRIVIAAERPADVPEENWLPIERKDLDLDLNMRIYTPDLEKYKSWNPPKARKLDSQ
ncbi:DUF1214 domain-containing protein [Sulfuriroseicoccus oceanibius]|uniref:DUF1214 domain-containing protein n=1 Tax=Sulfuriroseicoccus oceanibius TaxID=2707525 RepID=A0A6B3L6Q2_9BACT|nr:DUF1214 domain-containing protein [Sulfuriroseicoccus oceanibius]QQL44862.1 DUF1214 domain-containing protein [Sulfuriroseicoccus oceanibius]